MVDLKKITEAVHHIADAAHHLTHNIADAALDMVQNPSQRIARLLEEKGISAEKISQEKWDNNTSHNVVVAGDGRIVINDDTALARGLLNAVLFTDKGVKRVNDAMRNDATASFDRIELI